LGLDRAWLDAVTGRKQHFGVRGMIPYADQVQEARGRKTADFIGINYYTKNIEAGHVNYSSRKPCTWFISCTRFFSRATA
jgi:beta-glucosidase/6-phospho-beta-glucosidase/beta-galactosidase